MENIQQQDFLAETYYRDHFITSNRSPLDGDYTLEVIVDEHADLMQYAQAASLVWAKDGEYPHSFTGIVKKQTGNCFSTFQYEGIPALDEKLSA